MDPVVYTEQETPRSRKSVIVVIIVAILVVAAIVVVVLLHKASSSHSVSATGKQAIIQITADGFVPANLQVKAGTTIVWRNTDTGPHVVASNPYTKDSSLPALHSKAVVPNGSYTYIATSTGTIKYHDDMFPLRNGTVTVIN